MQAQRGAEIGERSLHYRASCPLQPKGCWALGCWEEGTLNSLWSAVQQPLTQPSSILRPPSDEFLQIDLAVFVGIDFMEADLHFSLAHLGIESFE